MLGVLLEDVLVHEEPRGRRTDLAGVAHLPDRACHCRRLDIGVLADDHGCVTPQFHEYGRHVLRGKRCQVPADGRRARERDETHAIVAYEVIGDLRRCPEYEVQYAGRQPGVVQRLCDMQCAGRRLLGGFEYDRTARGDRASHLSARLAHGKVPRGETGDDADRLVVDDVADTLGARNDSPVGPGCLAGIPLEKLAASNDLELGLVEGLAVLGRNGVGNLLLPFAH